MLSFSASSKVVVPSSCHLLLVCFQYSCYLLSKPIRTFPFMHPITLGCSFSSNPFSTSQVVIKTFKELCFFRHSLPASIRHPDVRCISPSTHFPHSRYLSESVCMPLFFFHALVSIICFCILIVAHAFSGSMLHLSHSCLPSSMFLYKSLCIC